MCGSVSKGDVCKGRRCVCVGVRSQQMELHLGGEAGGT